MWQLLDVLSWGPASRSQFARQYDCKCNHSIIEDQFEVCWCGECCHATCNVWRPETRAGFLSEARGVALPWLDIVICSTAFWRVNFNCLRRRCKIHLKMLCSHQNMVPMVAKDVLSTLVQPRETLHLCVQEWAWVWAPEKIIDPLATHWGHTLSLKSRCISVENPDVHASARRAARQTCSGSRKSWRMDWSFSTSGSRLRHAKSGIRQHWRRYLVAVKASSRTAFPPSQKCWRVGFERMRRALVSGALLFARRFHCHG